MTALAPPVRDGVVAFARIVGAVRCDRSDLDACRDLTQQLGQHWRVTDMAPGDLDGPDLQRLFVDAEMDLAPQASFRAAMLARMPLSFTLGLDAGAVDQQVQGPCEPR